MRPREIFFFYIFRIKRAKLDTVWIIFIVFLLGRGWGS